jgi:serine/threonine protein kinase
MFRRRWVGDLMDALTAQDPVRIGPFRLVARLGQGGMGRVYLGRDESSGRHAAVKTIHGELAADPEFRTRFTQEVNAALRVRDEYIAEVVLADPAGAVPWLATAYVPGISVEDAVRKYGPMPAESVRILGVCVARAVAAIHGVGLVHRDLKPGNVLLTAQGPKVIDFGIARGVGDEGLTKTGMVAGSPPYMAPEQLVTGEFGPASDVFSLGSILHYAATAAGPYGRGGAQELYARALAVGPVVAPDLPEMLAGPIARALARDPAARPSAAGFGALLETEPGEKPVPGWLPSNVTQEILTQATEALNTASAAYNEMSSGGSSPAGQQGGGQPGPQSRPAFAPPFPQSGPPSNPPNPSNPSSPRNPVYGTPPPSHPSDPRNPVFAPPSSGPSRTFGPPQQVFQQPQPQSQPRQQYPQTPQRQTPLSPPPQRPYPQQQAPGGFGQPQRPGTPPQGTGYRYPQTPTTPQAGRRNGMGTAGLTLGIIGLILPCLLILGVVFSGIGLSRSSTQGLPGGTSKAGMTVSLIGIVGWVLLVILGATHGSSSSSS